MFPGRQNHVCFRGITEFSRTTITLFCIPKTDNLWSDCSSSLKHNSQLFSSVLLWNSDIFKQQKILQSSSDFFLWYPSICLGDIVVWSRPKLISSQTDRPVSTWDTSGVQGQTFLTLEFNSRSQRVPQAPDVMQIQIGNHILAVKVWPQHKSGSKESCICWFLINNTSQLEHCPSPLV